jgi:hypothetical protein
MIDLETAKEIIEIGVEAVSDEIDRRIAALRVELSDATTYEGKMEVNDRIFDLERFEEKVIETLRGVVHGSNLAEAAILRLRYAARDAMGLIKKVTTKPDPDEIWRDCW